MKRTLCVLFVLGCAVNAYAQQKKEAPKEASKEVTKIKTTTTTVSNGVDLLGGETFNVIDATPLKENTIDLRLAGRYMESTGMVTRRQNAGTAGKQNKDADDNDWIITPELVWGACENLELSLGVPTWIGNSWDIPGQQDGNYDAYFGALWQFKGQQDYWPAMALGTTMRAPTGEHSNGFDAELRLSMTNEYDNGLRSHLNFFGATVNTDNNENARHFQYGTVVGMDGPLCDGGAVRWVLDYMWRISDSYGGGHMNVAEAGWQWQIADAHKLGMSVQAGLDHAEDSTANVGAALTYAYTIAN